MISVSLMAMLAYMVSAQYNYDDHGSNWDEISSTCGSDGTIQSPVDLGSKFTEGGVQQIS